MALGAVGLGIRRSFEPDYQNKSYVRQGPIPWHEKQGGYTIPYRNGQRQFGEEQYLHNPPPPIEYPPPTIRPMIGPTMEPLGPFDPRGGPMDMGLYSPPSGPRFPPPGPRFPPRWGGSSSSDSDYTDSDTALSLIHSDFRPNGYERIRRPYRPHHSPDEFPRGFIPDPDEGMYDGRAYGGGRVFGPLDQDVYRTGIDYGDNRARRRSDIYRNDSDDSF